MRVLQFAIVLALLTLGCGNEEKPTVLEREGEVPVVSISDEDAEMKAAVSEARRTLDGFIAELQKGSQHDLSIKARVQDSEGEAEHIWVDELTYQDGFFSGKLGNEPVNLKGMKLGTPVKVKREDVEDWIIFDGNELKGGFTVKVVEKRMQEAKQ